MDFNFMLKNYVSRHLFLLVLFCASLNAQKVNGNYNYKSSCVDIENDGSLTLLSWGKGRNRNDAVEQAKKNAVSDILFVGIFEGNSVCSRKPLIGEVNARDRYQEYFNEFFKDGGDFLNFISLKDERIGDHIFRDRKRSSNGVNISVVLRVLVPELVEKLKKDLILK